MNQQKKTMMYLAISNLFLVFLGVGLVIPVIPLLKDVMNFSGTTMGLMISVFALFQLLLSPIAGYFSDKIGRKQMIVSGMLIFAISEFMFGVAQQLIWFYTSRALGGIAAAFLMPAVTAYVADLTTSKERAKAMGLVSASISGGFIIGPGIGGLIAHFGIRAPFFAASGVAFLGFVMSLLILKEPERHLDEPDTPITVHSEERSVIDILKHPEFSVFFIIILISSFGLQAFESIYSIMTRENFGFQISQIAIIITISGTLALICQIFLFNQIVQRIGELALIQLTFFLSAIFIALIAKTNNHWVVVGSTFIIFLSFDLFRPAVTTYLSKNAGNRQGTVNGLNSTFTSVGNILGPLAAGYLFDLHHRAPYYVSAVILGLTGILAFFFSKFLTKKQKTRSFIEL